MSMLNKRRQRRSVQVLSNEDETGIAASIPHRQYVVWLAGKAIVRIETIRMSRTPNISTEIF